MTKGIYVSALDIELRYKAAKVFPIFLKPPYRLNPN